MVSKKKETQVIIGHVGIEASSLENSRKFYEVMLEALGFRVVLDSKESVGFSNGNFQIWLSEPQKPRFKCEAPRAKSSWYLNTLPFWFRTGPQLTRSPRK